MPEDGDSEPDSIAGEIELPEETLPVEWVKRSSLLPNDWNPNSMHAEKREELIHSILDNGWTQPIVRKGGTDTIVDGEQRWHAVGDERISENEAITPDGIPAGYVPVFDLHVDHTQARVATVQHNVNGQTDSDKFGSIMANLESSGMLDDAVERLSVGEVAIDSLIERATAEDDAGDEWTDDADESDDGAFTEQVEFQFTRPQYELVAAVLGATTFTEVVKWAVDSNVHSQTRVDMRALSDRTAEYRFGEDTIEYSGVDVESRLADIGE